MAYGYKTILEIENEEFEVNACTYNFDKEINENGEVTSPIQGGLIYLSISEIPKNSLLEWGIKSRFFRNGKIKVVGHEDNTPIVEEEVAFEGAACLTLKMVYNRDSTNYFNTLLTLSPECICIGRNDCWINKEWTK